MSPTIFFAIWRVATLLESFKNCQGKDIRFRSPNQHPDGDWSLTECRADVAAASVFIGSLVWKCNRLLCAFKLDTKTRGGNHVFSYYPIKWKKHTKRFKREKQGHSKSWTQSETKGKRQCFKKIHSPPPPKKSHEKYQYRFFLTVHGLIPGGFFPLWDSNAPMWRKCHGWLQMSRWAARHHMFSYWMSQ